MTTFRTKYVIEADSRQAKAQIQQIDSQFQKLGKGMGSLGASFGGNLAADAVGRLSAILVDGGRAVFDYAGNVEQARIALTTLTGDAKVAARQIAEMEALTRRTPLQFESVAKMSQGLKASGIEVTRLTGLIEDIGNVAAATGELTADRMESIGLAITQVVQKQRLQGEEILQLQERGVPALQILSQQLGKTTGEISKMASQGKISSEVFLEAFSRFSKQNYGDAMAKQAATFRGSVGQISNILLQAANESFKPFYEEISKFSATVARSLKEQESQGKQAGVSFGKALGEGVGEGIGGWFGGSGGGLPTTGNPLVDMVNNAVYGIAKSAFNFGYDFAEGFDKGQKAYASGKQGLGLSAGATLPSGPINLPGIGNDPKKAANDADKARREWEQREAKRIAAARAQLARELAEREAMIETALARNAAGLSGYNEEFTNKDGKQELRRVEISEKEHYEARRKLASDFLQFKTELLERELATVKGHADEEADVKGRLAVHNLAIEKLAFEQAVENSEREQQMLDAEINKIQQINNHLRARLALEESLAAFRDMDPPRTVTGQPGYDAEGNETGLAPEDRMPSWMGEWLNMTHVQSSVEIYGNLMADMKSMTLDTFGAMGDAIGESISNWVLYGDAIGGSLRKATAAILANIAQQAAVQAVWETAQGLAKLALAWFGHPAAGKSAAAHFAAAAVYGGIAAGAAIAGRAVAGDSFSGGASAGSSSGSSRSNQGELSPISRQNELTFASGRPREGNAFQQAAAAIERLEAKIAAMRPGDVVTVGVKQSPGVIGEAVSRDISRNSSIGAKIARNIGMR
jgi:tape measure domain-containing protein